MPRNPPLISLEVVTPPHPPPSYADAHDDEEEKDAPPKRWYHYLPLCCKDGTLKRNSFSDGVYDHSVVLLLMLAPHPSLLIVLVNYHLRVLGSPARFTLHLAVAYTLSFLAFSSLIVILARDPGPVNVRQPQNDSNNDGEDMNVMQALLTTNDDDMHSPGKWCRKCWAPKPERAHQ